MSIFSKIPYQDSKKEGLIQSIINTTIFQNINITYSSIDSEYDEIVSTDYLFTDIKNKYFCTLEDGNYSNYVTLEFKGLFLYPTAYVINSPSSNGNDYLMNWNLTGSMNGKDWRVLHHAKDNHDLSESSPHWYKVYGGPFRYLKIVQTGPSAGDDDIHTKKIRIQYFDIFGIMTDQRIITYSNHLKFHLVFKTFIFIASLSIKN